MELYLESSKKEYLIVDDKGKKYTVEEAKLLVESGKVTDCNLSFQRLMLNNYDLEAVKKFYREHPR